MSRPKSPDSEITTVYYRHRQIAQKALGRPLPLFAVIHHVDENPWNNENTNLVICPSEAYHNLLHMRSAAYDVCGNANWKKCYVCKQYDEESNLRPVRKRNRNITTFYHNSCVRAYVWERKNASSVS